MSESPIDIPGEVYLVGGAVRDELLGLEVTECDWVVVGSTAEKMLAAGFRQADPDFPVFLHPETGEEYALARRETKIGAGYRGFAIDASESVTLEEDLLRRDLTINAMARDTHGELIDPLNGQADLLEARLRHITPAFAEDPLRLLRVARFAAKLGGLDFRLAHATHRLMREMVEAGAVKELLPQRTGQEMRKAFKCEQPWRFFEVLQACGALQQLAPGLAACMSGVGHGNQTTCDSLLALQRVSQSSNDSKVRFVSLFLQTADDPAVLEANLAPERQSLDLLSAARRVFEVMQQQSWANKADQIADLLTEQLQRLRAWHRDGRFEEVLAVLAAQPGIGGAVKQLEAMREAGLAISAESLVQQGYQGAALGSALAEARLQAIAGVINETSAG